MADKLTIWAVYKNPSDYPGHYVLRAHDTPGGPRADCFVSKSLARVREKLPPGLVKLAKHPADDPTIYEAWI